MLTLGSLGFAAPLALIGLVALPVIYWLLRVTPPAPKRVRFPAIRLLAGLGAEEETPAHTPLWLLLMRLGAAALLILAFANPLLNPSTRATGSGPLLIAVDNGWTAAREWERRSDTLAALIAGAAREERAVALLPTAPARTAESLNAMRAEDAGALAETLQPSPFATDRQAATKRLMESGLPDAGGWQVVWLTDGIASEGDEAFGAALATYGPVEVVADPAIDLPRALRQPHQAGQEFEVTVIRAPGGKPDGTVYARGAEGRLLTEAPFTFEEDRTSATVTLAMPLELRNDVARLEIAGENTAGAVALLDDRWQRRTVGLIAGGGSEGEQPLLSDLYYLRRAISPFAEVREPRTGDDTSEVEALLARPLSMLVLADVGRLVGEDETRVTEWVEGGGTLVRFAGPRLAAKADSLTPVPLRGGGRALGGALTWASPQGLAPFPDESPFEGIAIPEDVQVNRQVLAEPGAAPESRTWARLNDGTPLVTAARRGEGWIVLFHVSANTEWSNLPISGLYVEMLRRLLDLSRGTAGAETGEATLLPPLAALDGYGRLGTPPPLAEPIARNAVDTTVPGPRHPPGQYGQPESFRALNTVSSTARLSLLDTSSFADSTSAYAGSAETSLKPLLLVLAALLLLADGVAALVLSGRLALAMPAFARSTAALLLLPAAIAVALAMFASPARAAEDEPAQPGDDIALLATLETRLAYVRTGDRQVDEMSRAGLSGLSQVLSMRTAVEPADPLGVDVENDELSFYPLLYWPILPAQEPLSPQALARVDSYMKRGGTILFDTRDQQSVTAVGNTPANQALRDLLSELDIPPLEPVPEGHVLTKAFYLLQSFPGRWAGGELWVEAGSNDPTIDRSIDQDGVTPIIIGSNDYAAAWALDTAGRPLAQPVPGGERQREMAQRFGINLVMYALTGNYKADQVHVPALLERLGQ